MYDACVCVCFLHSYIQNINSGKPMYLIALKAYTKNVCCTIHMRSFFTCMAPIISIFVCTCVCWLEHCCAAVFFVFFLFLFSDPGTHENNERTLVYKRYTNVYTNTCSHLNFCVRICVCVCVMNSSSTQLQWWTICAQYMYSVHTQEVILLLDRSSIRSFVRSFVVCGVARCFFVCRAQPSPSPSYFLLLQSISAILTRTPARFII